MITGLPPEDEMQLDLTLDALRAFCRDHQIPLVLLMSHGQHADGTHKIRVVGSQLGTPQTPPIFETIVDTFVKMGELTRKRD